MRLGFEQASRMMVQYSAGLEAQLADALIHQEMQLQHIRKIEDERKTQDTLVTDLLQDLERERLRVENTTAEQAMAQTVEIMKAKQVENDSVRELQAKISRYSALVDQRTGDLPPEAESLLQELRQHASATQTLPAGWEAAVSPEGLTYYIDHTTESTSWVFPSGGLLERHIAHQEQNTSTASIGACTHGISNTVSMTVRL